MKLYEHFPPSYIRDIFLHPSYRNQNASYRQMRIWVNLSDFSLTTLHIKPIRRQPGFTVRNIWAFYSKVANMRKIKFVSIRLNKSDEKPFHKWMTENQEDFDQLLFMVIQSGYKFSLTHDPQNSAYISALTGTEDAAYNQNMSFSSWSDNPFECVMLALYKHLVLASSADWGTIETSKANWG